MLPKVPPHVETTERPETLLACAAAPIQPAGLAASSRGVDDSNLQVSVLVLDTQTLFRFGLVRLLSEDDRILVAGALAGGRDVPDQCASQSIDVVLTDIQVRHWNAVALTRTIAVVAPHTRCWILAAIADWRVIPAMASGAAGFLVKDAEPEAVRSAVVSAHLGTRFSVPRQPDGSSKIIPTTV